jgi:hypothetical protein
MIFNPITFTPSSTFVRGRILTMNLSYAATPGGTRELPADIGTSRPSSRIRPPSRKQHPDNAGSSLPSLEPVQHPLRPGVSSLD